MLISLFRVDFLDIQLGVVLNLPIFVVCHNKTKIGQIRTTFKNGLGIQLIEVLNLHILCCVLY